MRAGPRIDPGERVDLLGDRAPHELVPGRRELDLVDALPVAVVAAQHRRLLVRLLAQAQGRGLAEPGAEAAEPGLAPGAALAQHGGAQRVILLEQVDALQRRRLVGDLVGGGDDRRRAHDLSSPARARADRDRASACRLRVTLARPALPSC